MTRNKNDDNALNSFERKVLRCILGPINDRGTWRLRYNKEVYNHFKEPCISTIIKFKKLEWAGHVTRMENKRIPLKIMQTELGGRRTVGRPKNRWMDVVERDVRQLMGLRNWRRIAMDRREWRGLLREAKARHRAVTP